MEEEGRRREREKERGPTDETAVFETLVSRLAAPRGILFWYTIILFCRLIGIIVVHCWTDEFAQNQPAVPGKKKRFCRTLIIQPTNATIRITR